VVSFLTLILFLANIRQPGRQAAAFIARKKSISLGFLVSGGNKPPTSRASKVTKQPTARDRGSPSRPTARRLVRAKQPDLDGFVVSDDDDDPYEPVDDEEDSLGFAPIREAPPRSKNTASAASTRTTNTTNTTKTTRTQKEPKVGKPITTDNILDGLNAYEIDLIERFEKEAKAFRDEVSILPSVFVLASSPHLLALLS
jgi:hypothetical protein